MSSIKQRVDRVEHYFGDMYSRNRIKKIIQPEDPHGPQDIKSICRELLDELGYTTPYNGGIPL